jgi:hypothetical protein
MVEHQPSKHKALNLNPSTVKNKPKQKSHTSLTGAQQNTVIGKTCETWLESIMPV